MNKFTDYLLIILFTISSCCFFISFEQSKIRAYREKTNVNRLDFVAAILFLASAVIKLMSMFWNDEGIGVLSYKQRVIIGIIASVLSAAFYVYVLFIALPLSTYGKTSETSLVSSGIYGKCRHPGVYAFTLCALSMAFLGGSWQLLIAALFYSGLNLLYVYLQDIKYIPQYIKGYEEYKKEVPFLAFWKK